MLDVAIECVGGDGVRAAQPSAITNTDIERITVLIDGLQSSFESFVPRADRNLGTFRKPVRPARLHESTTVVASRGPRSKSPCR